MGRAGTNGAEFVTDVAKELSKLNVLSVSLTPRSVYAMTGLSRYDLRHAVVNDGESVRVSVTFRSCPRARQSTPSAEHAADRARPPLQRGHLSPASAGSHPQARTAGVSAWFDGHGAISMSRAIAEGTSVPRFETSVAGLLSQSRRERGNAMVDLCSSEDEGDESGVEHTNANQLRLRTEIEQRASAPCGSSTCRFDGACFRRDVAHWLQFAHPCEVAKDYCPNLASGRECFNKGKEVDRRPCALKRDCGFPHFRHRHTPLSPFMSGAWCVPHLRTV